MSNYIDGFILPVPRAHLEEYKLVVEKVANIWKEYGALDYREYVGDDLELEGVSSFLEMTNSIEDEVIVFGWVVFGSKDVRDQANKLVAGDPRMEELVEPLTNQKRLMFDAKRMFYGGFKPLTGNRE